MFNLRIIPLLPFLGAALLMVAGRHMRRQWVHLFATLAIGGACLATIATFFGELSGAVEHGGLRDVVWTWIASGDLKVDLALRMDSLSGLLCLIITFIGTLIHIYSTGYMADDPDPGRFFAYLNLFCGAMLVLVLGDSLPVMFIGWEGVGLCSYLLIGFWYGEKANADAGKKAFIVNRVGDFGFLLGMFLLFYSAGTLDIPQLISIAKTSGGPLHAAFWAGQPVAFWASLLLFVGATGKSAQIPLYVWLPDAMAGPTPVSALIHAATMVTAGVYMVARMSALYMIAPAVLAIVALIGAATALWAAIIGFGQNDFKKVLAYSTVSQLGFMFAGVGTGAFGAGIFHLFTHAFFKAGLFLVAGAVMHAMGGSGDIRIMGGLRNKMPGTHLVFFICWLAICGVPVFSGFFSKDSIIASAFGTHIYPAELAWVGKAVGGVLLLAALGTAFYMSRLYYLVWTGESRADAHTQAHVHEAPTEMLGPLYVLAAGAALGGVIGLPLALGALFGISDINWLGHWLDPAVGAEMEVSHALEWGIMGVSTVVALAGIGLAYLFYGGGYRAPARTFASGFPWLVSLAGNAFRIDRFYDIIIVRPLKLLSRGLFRFVDRILIDQVLVGGAALLVDIAARLARTFQVGDVQRYLAAFAVGVVALFYLATRPPEPNLHVKVDGMHVTVDASEGAPPGRPLSYEFDFDEDGHPDKEGDRPTASFSYEGRGTYTIRVTVRDLRWSTTNSVKQRVSVK
jgi:NADH-quinone oxidoreductase subunit L